MDPNAKQLVAEKLRNSSNVLITVSKNPTVDQLASAIGLSLMLDKLNKHTTTVFSGQIPDTMQFLEPQKTFDSSVDGLRDFIISLDKDKADKLRYKVEDDVVKIFITPYQGKLTEADLEFSQGDFNVDLVVALGVNNRDDLDQAITSHGRILHDAAIVTVSAGSNQNGNIGGTNWNDENASSTSEMLVSISEALEGGILDGAMSSAFLTGIVAETDRFKNKKTSPKVMTMAAQLMAGGANQQLIASNLQMDAPTDDKQVKIPNKQGNKAKFVSDKDSLEKIEETFDAHKDGPKYVSDKDSLDKIEKDVDAHQAHGSLSDIEREYDAHQEGKAKKPDVEDPAIQQLEAQIEGDGSMDPANIEGQIDNLKQAAQPAPGMQLPQLSDNEMPGLEVHPNEPTMPNTPSVPPVQPQAPPPQQAPQNPAQAAQFQIPPQPQQSTIGNRNSLIGQAKGQGPKDLSGGQPTMGGTFNATSNEAHNAAEQERLNGINNEILNHGNVAPTSEQSTFAPPQPTGVNNEQNLIDQARQDVDAAMNAQYHPDNNPVQSLGAQPLGDQIHIDNAGTVQPPPPQVSQPQQQAAPPAPPLPPPPQNGNVPQGSNTGQMYVPPEQYSNGTPPPPPPNAPPPMPPYQ